MKAPLSVQKLRGGYYTSPPLARFLVQWAVQKSTDSVLEPSCGDGAFFDAIIDRLIQLRSPRSSVSRQITAVEFDAEEATKAANRLAGLLPNLVTPPIINSDFFAFRERDSSNHKYNAIVGNPPFIRYQQFPEAQREIAFRLMRQLGLHPSRLTNAWLPFIALCSDMLADRGRLAMIVPAELLQVNYAAELREFLSNQFSRLTVFAFRHLIFEGIQQEVVLLCGQRNGESGTAIRTIELNGLEDLDNYEHSPFDRHDLKPLNHSADKWTQYFLSGPQILALRKTTQVPGLQALGRLADVNVGVVTGLNDFFVLNKSSLASVGANGYTLPLVARSGHLGGLIFSRRDWDSNVTADLNAFLLAIDELSKEKLPKKLQKYILEAEIKGWHMGYKCRIRDPWFQVPSIWVPDAFMLRQIHDAPRIIANEALATCTDTIHRVRVKPSVDPRQLASCIYNSLSFALTEVMGRSYGGGVLELEPREATQLLVPYSPAKNIDIDKLNSLVRRSELEAALDYSDNVLLIKGLGMTKSEVRQFRAIWNTLRERRYGRKYAKPVH